MIARLSELAPPGRGADMGQRLSTRGRLVRAPAASNDQSIEWIVDQGFGHQLHANELATNPPL